MFLKDKRSGDLVGVDDVNELCNPFRTVMLGRDQTGEEEQDPAEFEKDKLVFPSGESLPRCWLEVKTPNAELAGS